MSEAKLLADSCEELAKEIDHSHFTHDLLEAAAELRRLSAELEALKKAMGEPVACVQHFKGDKGRLFFFDEVSPPPGSDAYVDDVTWTLLCAIQKDKP